jgi:hypothetical protein
MAGFHGDARRSRVFGESSISSKLPEFVQHCIERNEQNGGVNGNVDISDNFLRRVWGSAVWTFIFLVKRNRPNSSSFSGVDKRGK